MEPISARSNPRVKAWKALAADSGKPAEGGRIWLDGEHLVKEALAAGWTIETLLLTPQAPYLAAGQTPKVQVTAEVMAAISTLDSAPSMAAVALPQSRALGEEGDVVVLDAVQDPGNVGTILRTAWAMGCAGVLLLPGCANPWSAKTLRAGQGAQCHLPVHQLSDADLQNALSGRPLWVTALDADKTLAQAAGRGAPRSVAWVFGHEGQGVRPALQRRAARRVRIPMPGEAESLNVAVACALCLYERIRS
ncbi:TrmH family RNA methyltransferase [Piscinibacterium candidicorallinum]|uniref:TrmH family RNA methyltransferase n=1 Tax=Piscinibacterium candidicorallinum TaxID=1793872 RepID=A0ABV7H5P0_9BURK